MSGWFVPTQALPRRAAALRRVVNRCTPSDFGADLLMSVAPARRRGRGPVRGSAGQPLNRFPASQPRRSPCSQRSCQPVPHPNDPAQQPAGQPPPTRRTSKAYPEVFLTRRGAPRERR